MPRPKAPDPKQAITIRLPASTLDAIGAQAAAEGVTVRLWCQRALLDAVGGHDRQPTPA